MRPAPANGGSAGKCRRSRPKGGGDQCNVTADGTARGMRAERFRPFTGTCRARGVRLACTTPSHHNNLPAGASFGRKPAGTEFPRHPMPGAEQQGSDAQPAQAKDLGNLPMLHPFHVGEPEQRPLARRQAVEIRRPHRRATAVGARDRDPPAHCVSFERPTVPARPPVVITIQVGGNPKQVSPASVGIHRRRSVAVSTRQYDFLRQVVGERGVSRQPRQIAPQWTNRGVVEPGKLGFVHRASSRLSAAPDGVVTVTAWSRMVQSPDATGRREAGQKARAERQQYDRAPDELFVGQHDAEDHQSDAQATEHRSDGDRGENAPVRVGSLRRHRDRLQQLPSGLGFQVGHCFLTGA